MGGRSAGSTPPRRACKRRSQRCLCRSLGRVLKQNGSSRRHGNKYIAGGAQKVKQAAANLGISVADKVEAKRSLAGVFSARASDARADALDVRSSVSGWSECIGMNIAGGAQKVKQAAADLGISAADQVEAQRSNAAFFALRNDPGRMVAAAMTALASRGMFNSNLGVQARNTRTLYDWESKLGRRSWGQCNGRDTLPPLPRT